MLKFEKSSKRTFSEWDNYFYANYDLSEYSDKEEKVKLMTEIYLRKVRHLVNIQ